MPVCSWWLGALHSGNSLWHWHSTTQATPEEGRGSVAQCCILIIDIWVKKWVAKSWDKNINKTEATALMENVTNIILEYIQRGRLIRASLTNLELITPAPTPVEFCQALRSISVEQFLMTVNQEAM